MNGSDRKRVVNEQSNAAGLIPSPRKRLRCRTLYETDSDDSIAEPSMKPRSIFAQAAHQRNDDDDSVEIIEIDDSDSDSDSSSPQTEQVTTADTPAAEKVPAFFQTHCWLCHVQLVPEEGHVCCYAMHTHPILNTPVCSVCYEVMQARDHNTCAGCGEESEMVFLCDNLIQGLICQNEFCSSCIEKAGLNVSVLQASKDEWHCLACNPPSTLQALCVSEEPLPLVSERSVEDILQELEVAEEKKRECEEALEDANRQLKAQEIMQELKETVPESELEEAVREELCAWEELQIRHEARLGDFISKLQDGLEFRGIDMATVYHGNEYLSIPTPALPNVTPEWVQTAEKDIQQRGIQENALPVKLVLPAEEYKKDYSEDVVEIAELNETPNIVGPKGSGWVHSRYRPTLVDIQEACQEEDEGRARKRINTEITRRTETRDKAMTKCEGPTIRNKNGRMVVEHRRERARSRSKRSASSFTSKRKSGDSSRLVQASSNEIALSQDSELISISDSDGPFIDSDVILCTPAANEGSLHSLETEGVVRKVTIAKGFASVLKTHQKDGVKFIWRNSFIDFEKNYTGDETDPRVGGCILAHHMGLGKTLTTISLLHTVLTHPAMMSPQHDKRMLRTVILVVPVNTLANWKNEFTKWFVNVNPKVFVCTPSEVEVYARKALISKWMSTGGIFLVSSKTFANLVSGNGQETELIRADVLVVDEAHSMIKNSSTQIFKALSSIETKRRILLSGSPFQNNLLEYFHICNFIRKGILGDQNQFKTKFIDPISQGQLKDSTQRQKALTAMLSADLRKLVDAHVHRRDLSILEQDLPKLSQVVIHVRPSHIQSKIYRTYEQARSSNAELKGFFKMYSELSPVHNHPSCLLMKYSTTCTEESNSRLWCKKYLSTDGGAAKLGKITGGNKIVLLLHLLAFAEVLGEKVLIFSQYLSTLDYIENVLKSEEWISQVPSLSCFSGQRLGGWEKGRHYLRIDGSSSSAQRGDSINAFNNDGDDGDLRAFLISSMAGSLGINLTSASRVILVDSHFNPTVMAQAVFRAYRYGQQKPVHCYRLLTEGTMEEKIYGRSVNKTGLALRLVDSKAIEGCFTAKELEDFQQFDSWVQCDKCEKWRMLIRESAEDLPERWFCEMNADHRNNSCDDPERDQAWYYRVFENGVPTSPMKRNNGAVEQPKCQPEEEDEILSHLLHISEREKGTSMISRHYYHDSLLQSTNDSEEVEQARILLANETAENDDKNQHSQGPSLEKEIETGLSFSSSLSGISSNITEKVPLHERKQSDFDSNESAPKVADEKPLDPSLSPKLADEKRVDPSLSPKLADEKPVDPSLSPELADQKRVDQSPSPKLADEKRVDLPRVDPPLSPELADQKFLNHAHASNPEIIDICDTSDDDS